MGQEISFLSLFVSSLATSLLMPFGHVQESKWHADEVDATNMLVKEYHDLLRMLS